ncbi:MAG: hypothetical protein K2M94_03425 [Paramuribaculum sp.]|nr:hypothetical protein [Paramuribaculum sp.]
MKKRFLFALGILVSVAGFALSSCSDDDDNNKSKKCSCTESGPDGSINKEIDSEPFGVSSCSELGDKFNATEPDGYRMTCY